MQTNTVKHATWNVVRLAGLCALLLVQACGSNPLGKLTDAVGARRMVDESRVILDATVPVGAGTHAAYSVSVAEGWQDVQIVGSFRASGGMGNDIVVDVMREEDYVNWANGHEARSFYSSGKLTTSSFNVGPLAPGHYRIVFDNSFSLLSRKSVSTRVELKYKGPR